MTTEKRPKTKMWKREPLPDALKGVRQLEASISVWRLGGLRVLSGLDEMKSNADPTVNVPHWHVSVSRRGGHASEADVVAVRRAFGMEEAEEDNHEPGRGRNLFLAVDPAHRAICECKTDELTIIEANGHQWQSPPDDVDRRRAMVEEDMPIVAAALMMGALP